jgi:putative ABC transport system permease protein
MAYFDEAMRRLCVLPGVVSAAAIDGLPGGDSIHGSGLRRADRPEPKLADVPIVLVNSVTPDYFRTMQTRLVHGRFFTDSDRKGAPPVAIIDVWAAQRYWPGEDPVGKSLRLERMGPAREIIGVMGNVSQGILIKMVKGELGQVYVPLAQAPKANLSLALRTAEEPTALAGMLQKTLHEIDPDEPVFLVRNMDASRAASEAPQTLATALLGGFAGVALLLAMIGIYGVVAYSAGRRTREIGIRVALGAQRHDVLRVLVGQGILLAVVGIAVGLAGAWVLTRQMASVLSGVAPTDPATFAGVCVLLAAAAIVASYVPARRATRVDPVEALRQE